MKIGPIYNRHRAFTLIELLVVIAIIAVLSAILFPVFSRVREKARQAVCMSNLKQISHAILLYSDDYDERFPMHQYPDGNSNFASLPPTPQNPWDAGNWVWTIYPYIKNWAVFQCPSGNLISGFGSATPPLFYTNYTMNGYMHRQPFSAATHTERTFLLVEGLGAPVLDGYGACFPVPRWTPPNPDVTLYLYFSRVGLGQNHQGGSICTYLDGHAKWQPSPGLNGLVNRFPITHQNGEDFNINMFTPWSL